MANGLTTSIDTSSSEPPDANDDVNFSEVIGFTGYTLFICIILLLIFAGLARLIISRRKCQNRGLRTNTVSIFDLATIFHDDRDPYCTLGIEGTRSGETPRCLGTTRAPYTELTPNAENTLGVKSQEDLTSGNDLAVLPRKCNTLSGILWSRLGAGYKKSATLDRYLTAQRGSASSCNDYVDRCQEDIKPIQYRPSYMMMADARGTNSFVPEDDNLWERCSSDGSIEHDVLLRQDVDPNRVDGKDNRLSTMSDLLRSSWIEPREKEYFNIARCGSQLSGDKIGGVFIPESDLDPQMQDGEADINQVSQNIIDLITESFSAKIQKRESDDWNASVNDSITSKAGLDSKMPSLDNVLPESERVSVDSNIERTNSFSPIASASLEEYQTTFSKTLPRPQKRPLPPVPRRKTPTLPKNVETKTSLVLKPAKSADSLYGCTTTTPPEEKDGSGSHDEEDDYENMPGIIVRKQDPAKPNLNPAKKIPPPPPPKPKKKIFQPQFYQDSSPEGTFAYTSGSQQNVMKVTQELQEKLMFRLPEYATFRSRDEDREEDKNVN